MELETIFENGQIDDDSIKQPPWSFGEWKDMSLAENELFNHYCDPPRPLTPLPEDTERVFEDEEEWDEIITVPLTYSLYVLNLMGEENSSRKEDSSIRTEGDGSKKKKKRKKPRSQTKVILRRLPPTMTEGEFMSIMSPLPPYNYFHYCKADKSRGAHERTCVIFNFISELDAHDFIERYHDCVFYDSKGNEYISVCHLAPSQSVPKEEKQDPLMGTMKESEAFKNFMATYEESPETLFAMPVSANGPITPEMMAEELEKRPKHGPESTPLLDFIRESNSRPTKHNSLTAFKDVAFSKKSSIDKMRTIKKLDKRKERRDRERKEKKEKDVKSKKLKPGGKSFGDKKHEQSASGVREQDSSGPSSKSESVEVSTSAKSSNPSITSASKENGDKGGSEATASRESKFGKDVKAKVYSDKKPRSFKGSEFPGKAKDKTRWSKNSGLRTHYDDRAFEKKSSSRSSKPGDKPRRPSLEKEGNVKSSSTAGAEEGNSGNRSNQPSSSGISKVKTASDNKPAESASSKDASENKAESSAGPSGSTGKKVVIKKVIKKVRKVRTDDNEMPSKSNDDNSSIPSSSKKKFLPHKPKEDAPRPPSNSNKGGGGNSRDSKEQHESAPLKNPDKHDSNKEATASSSSKEKEKRVRKGRPDLQIYRPGSLRSTKPSDSNSNESKSVDPPKNEK